MIKKRGFDRQAHVSFEQFEFPYVLQVPFAEGVGRYCKITYSICASVKQDYAAIRQIIRDNITDISEPVIDLLNRNMTQLEGSYPCLKYQLLEAMLFNKVKEVVLGIPFLKIVIRQSSVERDIVSNKIIEDHETHELERARLLSEVENLKIQQEEAEIRRQEADIAEIKAQNEANMARIRRQQEMEEKQHEINKKIKDLEAEKDYDIKRSERAEAAARKDQELRAQFSIEELAAVDEKYEKFANLEQRRIDRERENANKNFDYYMKIINEIKDSEMDDSYKDEIMRKIFNESTVRIASQPDRDMHSENKQENEIVYDSTIREVGQEMV